MIDGDILEKQITYFSFTKETECRAVELITMGKNEPKNCLVHFTPHISNHADQILRKLFIQPRVFPEFRGIVTYLLQEDTK